ncbi:hypothetical protein [Pseudomarimonas arenosa]|uniref:Uncharacterized protein n=1 Tax=Pseudomarimonas arenosa TaxID=2774145 RepID=A0AAW3ZLH5_9GAMM|nr:hypothetical protein [Pseudomarimonas arenosa]MBD8526014.1 hypothetical protein [Pseudomarimonas arenosa]
MNTPITFALRHLLTGALALAPICAAAAPQVTLWPESPAVGQPFQVEILGEWAPACAPRVGDSWLEDDQIVVKLLDSEKQCADQPKAPLVLRSSSATPLSVDRAGTFQIRVLGGSPERTRAFGLAAVGDVELYTPESGLWWPERGGQYDTSGPGLGVQIEVQGDSLALNLSGYDNAGTPFWWFAAGASQALPQSLPLTALKGGSGPFAKYAAPVDALSGGTVHIEWLSSARAVFWFVRDPLSESEGLEVRPISMTRFAFGLRAGDSWRGDWVLLQRGAEGEVGANALRFDAFQADDNGFDLRAGDHWRLRCEIDRERPDSPPTACTLLNGNTLVGDFVDIGLTRLQGVSRSGQSLRLSRIEDGF